MNRTIGWTTALGLGALAAGCAMNTAPAGSAPVSLVGKTWVVGTVAGQAVAGTARPTLTFLADGRVSGHAGCNRFGADYRVEGDTLRFGPAAATKMACADPVMAVERRFFDTLAEVDGYRVENGALVLTTGTGAAIRAQ